MISNRRAKMWINCMKIIIKHEPGFTFLGMLIDLSVNRIFSYNLLLPQTIMMPRFWASKIINHFIDCSFKFIICITNMQIISFFSKKRQVKQYNRIQSESEHFLIGANLKTFKTLGSRDATIMTLLLTVYQFQPYKSLTTIFCSTLILPMLMEMTHAWPIVKYQFTTFLTYCINTSNFLKNFL